MEEPTGQGFPENGVKARGGLARDRLDMKVDPGRRAQWEAAAREDGVTLSVWIRMTLDAEVKRRKRRLP